MRCTQIPKLRAAVKFSATLSKCDRDAIGKSVATLGLNDRLLTGS